MVEIRKILFRTGVIMFRKFLRHRKYKKIIRISSAYFLKEFALIIDEMLVKFKDNHLVSNLPSKEILKFESISLQFWLLSNCNILSEPLQPLQKMILDEMHDQYYSALKRQGYTRELVQAVCEDFNKRYETYNDSCSDVDFARVGSKFLSFVCERSECERELEDLTISLYLIQLTSERIVTLRDEMKRFTNTHLLLDLIK